MHTSSKACISQVWPAAIVREHTIQGLIHTALKHVCFEFELLPVPMTHSEQGPMHTSSSFMCFVFGLLPNTIQRADAYLFKAYML